MLGLDFWKEILPRPMNVIDTKQAVTTMAYEILCAWVWVWASRGFCQWGSEAVKLQMAFEAFKLLRLVRFVRLVRPPSFNNVLACV